LPNGNNPLPTDAHVVNRSGIKDMARQMRREEQLITIGIGALRTQEDGRSRECNQF
jgi:hypothetical protein